MTNSYAIKCLETILNYNMSQTEAKAYKIGCIYIDTLKKRIPDYSCRSIENSFFSPKKDPRQKYLFKCCYKLIREIQHKLPDQYYPLYVQAQFDIIKFASQQHGNESPNFNPTCLTGEKAWKRWLVWKRIYDKKLHSKPVINNKDTPVALNVGENQIKSQLSHDKEFLFKKLQHDLTKDKVYNLIKDRVMFRWIAIGQISPYYAILSPLVNNHLASIGMDIDSMFHIDFNLYRPSITQNIKDFFNAEYNFES